MRELWDEYKSTGASGARGSPARPRVRALREARRRTPRQTRAPERRQRRPRQLGNHRTDRCARQVRSRPRHQVRVVCRHPHQGRDHRRPPVRRLDPPQRASQHTSGERCPFEAGERAPPYTVPRRDRVRAADQRAHRSTGCSPTPSGGHVEPLERNWNSATEGQRDGNLSRMTCRPVEATPRRRSSSWSPTALLADAIGRLPDRDRLIVVLSYYEGLTLAEIGSTLDITESRVCQIRTQAMKQLRRRLTASPCRHAVANARQAPSPAPSRRCARRRAAAGVRGCSTTARSTSRSGSWASRRRPLAGVVGLDATVARRAGMPMAVPAVSRLSDEFGLARTARGTMPTSSSSSSVGHVGFAATAAAHRRIRVVGQRDEEIRIDVGPGRDGCAYPRVVVGREIADGSAVSEGFVAARTRTCATGSAASASSRAPTSGLAAAIPRTTGEESTAAMSRASAAMPTLAAAAARHRLRSRPDDLGDRLLRERRVRGHATSDIADADLQETFELRRWSGGRERRDEVGRLVPGVRSAFGQLDRVGAGLEQAGEDPRSRQGVNRVASRREERKAVGRHEVDAGGVPLPDVGDEAGRDDEATQLRLDDEPAAVCVSEIDGLDAMDSGRWRGHCLGIGRKEQVVADGERLVEPECHVDTGTEPSEGGHGFGQLGETHDDGMRERSVRVRRDVIPLPPAGGVVGQHAGRGRGIPIGRRQLHVEAHQPIGVAQQPLHTGAQGGTGQRDGDHRSGRCLAGLSPLADVRRLLHGVMALGDDARDRGRRRLGYSVLAGKGSSPRRSSRISAARRRKKSGSSPTPRSHRRGWTGSRRAPAGEARARLPPRSRRPPRGSATSSPPGGDSSAARTP